MVVLVEKMKNGFWWKEFELRWKLEALNLDSFGAACNEFAYFVSEMQSIFRLFFNIYFGPFFVFCLS